MLYHVTPIANLPSILARGIKTACATGPERVVWLVNERRLLWAVEHIARRYDISTKDVAVLWVYRRRDQLVPTGLLGVWKSRDDVTPLDIGGCQYGHLLGEKAVRRDTIYLKGRLRDHKDRSLRRRQQGRGR